MLSTPPRVSDHPTAAATFAKRRHAGEAASHPARYEQLAELGVRTVFVALADLESADDLGRLAPVLDGL
jgi:hypothetical protein